MPKASSVQTTDTKVTMTAMIVAVINRMSMDLSMLHLRQVFDVGSDDVCVLFRQVILDLE